MSEIAYISRAAALATLSALATSSVMAEQPYEPPISIEAWIIQPDGTKIIVPPESIRTQDEGTEGGNSKFSDKKYKVIVFPQVRVGSRLYWKFQSFVHTPLFAGQFFRDFLGSVEFHVGCAT